MNDRTRRTRGASEISRRRMLGSAATLAAGAAVSVGRPAPASAAEAEDNASGSAATKGNIKQSIVQWCFGAFGEKWSVEQTCRAARELGCKSVELINPSDFPTLKKHGLTCAIANNGMPAPPFMKGFNNPKFHDEVIARTSKVIDACAEFGFPSTIAFTGYKWRDPTDPSSGVIPPDEGADNCVEGFKKIAGYAEQKGVTINLEMLNTRVTDHPMKGHPGYQGDHIDYCVDILKRVGSPRIKLLYDIYHAQIMDGDIIRRIREHKDYIGHIHTAGNPGRNELDPTQEIYYPATMRALLDVGYTGYVGQEFIPTIDPMKGLRQAVKLCDV